MPVAKAGSAEPTTHETRTQHTECESALDDEAFYLPLFRPELTDEEVRRVWRNYP